MFHTFISKRLTFRLWAIFRFKTIKQTYIMGGKIVIVNDNYKRMNLFVVLIFVIALKFSLICKIVKNDIIFEYSSELILNILKFLSYPKICIEVLVKRFYPCIPLPLPLNSDYHVWSLKVSRLEYTVNQSKRTTTFCLSPSDENNICFLSNETNNFRRASFEV